MDMKKFLIAAAAGASILAGTVATPAMAQDYGYSGYPGDGQYADGYRGDDGYGYRGDDGYRGDRREYRGHRRHGYNNYDRGYRGDRRCRGTTGAIIGGVLGALVGGEVGRGRYGGRSTTGTILGAGGGALLGREVSRSDCRRR
jgi:hypothetical protein